MRNLINFILSENKNLIVYLPCDLENLQFFDEISIKYWHDQIEYCLFNKDFVTEGIRSFANILEKCIKQEMPINSIYYKEGVGYHNCLLQYNNNFKEGKWEDLYDFCLWSTPDNIGINTYMYNMKNEICLEISPFWVCNDEEEVLAERIAYDRFLATYNLIDRILIPKELAKQWEQNCMHILSICTQNENR